MSSRQLEEQMEAEQHAAVAAALGLDPDYLSGFDYEVEPHESDEGVSYGANITFPGETPPELAGRLHGDEGNRWIRTGPL